MSASEMNAVRRLSAQEDNLEDIHAALSRRDTLRKSLSSNRMSAVEPANDRRSVSSKDDYDGYEDQYEDLRDRGSRLSEKLSAHRSSRSSVSNDDSSRSSTLNSDRRRRRSDRRRGSRTDPPDDGMRPTRSASAIEKLLEYKETGSHSATGNENFERKPKTSMNPLLVGLSKSRENSAKAIGRRSSHRRRSKSREQRHRSKSRSGLERQRSSSKPRFDESQQSPRTRQRSSSRPRIDESQQSPRTRQRVRRRRSTSTHKTLQDKGRTANRRGTKSLRATRSFMSQEEIKKEEGIPQDAFERLWGKKITREDSNKTNTSHHSNSSFSGSDTGTGNASLKEYSGSRHGTTPGKVKKTKLEKIHELQGQCDIYKSQLDAMTEERSKFQKELTENNEQVESLKKLVSAHEQQSTKLKLKFAEAEDELESKRKEQQKERTEHSETAKELARVNIEYSKSVDAARKVREELDGLKKSLAEREGKISVLQKELETSNENVRQLEADVLYADEQIDKLEAEIKKLESEVALYIEAANRDSLRDGDNDGMNLREAKNEAEKRKFEEREKDINEKQRMLEEKTKILEADMKELERQRTRYLEEQQLKEKEFEEKLARAEDERDQEEERLKMSDEEQLKKEEEMKERLAALEDENAALNGRLKSEQLESTMKLQNKENLIAELQKEMAGLTKQQKERDAAPDSSPSLLLEIEALKTEAVKRNSDFEDVRMKKIELEDEVEGLQSAKEEFSKHLGNLESEIIEHKKEAENQKRKTLEWQKKTGEWSEKAVMWKQRAEHWEKKAKESSNDSASLASDEAAQVEPQALFLAAAVEKRAANVSAANVNGSWRLGRRIFGMSSADSGDDETQALITKLEGENLLKETEIKALKSEMVKMQTTYKEQAYNSEQEYEKLQKEKAAIELNNVTLMEELELARKLNRTISESAL